MSAYGLPELQCLLIIGPGEVEVKKKVEETKGERVEIVGVVVTHSHHEYRVFVKQAGPGSLVEGPFVIPCDCVARSLKQNSDGKLRLQCCQDYTLPETAGPSEVWVQHLECKDEADQGQFVPGYDAFLVKGSFSYIDDLKKVIAEPRKWDPMMMLVYRKENGTWNRLPPRDKVVMGNTMETAYGFTIATDST